MHKPIHADQAGLHHPADGRLLWCALVPLFAIAEGTHRVMTGLRRSGAATGQRDWLTEAKTQASIATSYVLMARSLLH
ncbi:hypothetical protein DFR50_14836 [Roseiarcus fermentans]|uniref:Uncharacterized protein n=1 Tax=Roseiarcus fermentans TaxID=1473586 RepID=A0A366EN59_9HYPH|nr:hypothetical protein [Roseiarcus fermentans]RBP02895.1 hypothetical protein DFR50_14836 [Roseiarcus fermentans]